MMIQQSCWSEVIDIVMDAMQRSTNTSQQSTIYLAVMSDMYN